MLKSLLAGAAVALAAAATAQAQPSDRTAVCIDVNGALLAPACHGQASRLQVREDICLCPRGLRTQASICPPGVAPPPESLAIAQARRQILRNRRSLVGASFQGQALCVAPPKR